MYLSDVVQDKVNFKSKQMPIMGASQVALVVKNPPANAGDMRDSGLIPGLGRSPGGGNGNPLHYSCLGESHGQRSLVGCSLWGRKESDTAEPLKHTHTHTHTHTRPLSR